MRRNRTCSRAGAQVALRRPEVGEGDLVEDAGRGLLLLHEGAGRRHVAGEEVLRGGEALHLGLALLGALREGAHDPVAVRLDLGLVVLLLLEVILVIILVLLLVGPVALLVGDGLLEVRLLLVKGVLELLSDLHLLLVLGLGVRLTLGVVLDLVVEVLDDVAHEGDDALGLALARALVREGGIRGLILGDLELGVGAEDLHEGAALAALNLAHLELVLGVELGEGILGGLEESDRVLVVLLALLERLVLLLALLRDRLHVVLDVRDRLDGHLDLLLVLLDGVGELGDLGLVLLDLPVKVLALGLDLLVLVLALVALLDVLLALVLEHLHHVVDGGDNLVEVAGLGRLDLRGQAREAQAVGLRGTLLQRGEGLAHRRGHVLDASGLQEGGLLAGLDGLAEHLARLVAGEDLQSLVDARELLLAHLLAGAPLRRLVVAGLLGCVEELHVGLHLGLGVVVLLGGLGEHHLGLGLGLLGRLQGLLHLDERLLLRGDEGLEVAVLAGLVVIGLLEVLGHGAVHVRQDARDGRGLRRVLALHLGHVRQELELGLRQLRERGRRRGLHDGLDVRGHELRLALDQGGAGGRRAEDGDRLLEGGDRLLHLGDLGLVGLVLLRAERGGLLLGLLVLLDVRRRGLDLGGLRGHGALQAQDVLAELAEVAASRGDGISLAMRGGLAPARVLVVHRLLLVAVGLQTGLQVLQQIHNLLHRGAGVRGRAEDDAERQDGTAGREGLHCEARGKL
mmetsp:Transcript_68451/g.200955  ORF Transcript_68451/g.200955 Transcript_68451/m.200955 type:complete len:739 (+) Transcript_68451:64-2280(+)